jgi:hypothetical protein
LAGLEVEQLAHLHAAPDQFPAGAVDVRHDEVEPVDRPGTVEVLHQRHRAGRPGWRHLDDPELFTRPMVDK